MPWTSTQVGANTTRPGAYVNFVKKATAAITGGLSGAVAVAGQAAWGPDEVVQKITKESEIEDYYTKVETSPFDLPFLISQALKGGAKEVLAFRMEGANAAKGTKVLQDTQVSPANVITLTGKYNGARSDNFTVTVAANAENAARKDVTIKESGTELIKWTTTKDNAATGMVQALVDQINDDPNNFYITATFIAAGNNTLANVANSAWGSEGHNGDSLLAADYDAAMDALELEDWYCFVADTQDATILTNIKTWINTELRGSSKQVIFVTGSDTGDSLATAQTDAEAHNSKGIVHVFPGFKYKDFADVQQTARGSKAATRVAGMIAGAAIDKSITFKELTTIVDVEIRLSTAQIEDALGSGICALVWDGSKFKVERGINTLTVLGANDQENFNKISIVKMLDTIENTLRTTAANSLIGKYLNNSGGQRAVLTLFRDFLHTLVDKGVLAEDFTVELDDTQTSAEDYMYVKIGIKPIDSIEYIFMTIDVSI